MSKITISLLLGTAALLVTSASFAGTTYPATITNTNVVSSTTRGLMLAMAD